MEVGMFEILIIDDTRSVHAFLRSVLSPFTELTLTSVANGSEGLVTLQSGKSFDLILLDWEMPVMDGPTTFASLRANGCHTPVIMMTTKNEPDDISRMLRAGVNEYMMKPFTLDIILEKIEFATGKVIHLAS
jgi:two-component system chemotaxis response regulator CheY